MVTAVLLVLFTLILVATALALAGRWQPEGLPAEVPGERPPGQPARFDIVLRGYRMDQVDAEIERLRQSLAAQTEEVRTKPDRPTIQE